MSKKESRRPPLEEGLLVALKALDTQIAREMQRDPEDLEKFGVKKWEPYAKRMEIVTSFLLDAIGGQEINLDSLIVFSQATTKALSLIAHDLESKGLGKLRTSYCIEALKRINDDSFRGLQILKNETKLM